MPVILIYEFWVDSDNFGANHFNFQQVVVLLRLLYFLNAFDLQLQVVLARTESPLQPAVYLVVAGAVYAGGLVYDTCFLVSTNQDARHFIFEQFRRV